MMKLFATVILTVLFFSIFAPAANAQPNLSTLWPAGMGLDWEFDVRVEGPASELKAGIVTLTIAGQSELSSGDMVWLFDVESTVPAAALSGTPDGPSAFEQGQCQQLREKMAAARSSGVAYQPSSLLRVPPLSTGAGLLVDNQVAMGISDSAGDWSWWWMTTDLAEGSTFRRQLIPDLADDVFENGEVRTTDGAVTTPAGSFTNAVIIDYVLEWGTSNIMNGAGEVIGTATFETVGWVAFVPDVGPVASDETFSTLEYDCSECPPEFFEPVTKTMNLRATSTVPAERQSFGSFKARY